MKLFLIVPIAALLMSCGNLIKNGAIVEAQEDLNNHQYAQALENTEIAESFGDLSKADIAKLHFIRAQSLEGLGRQSEAILGYRFVVEQHGNSAYAAPSQQRLDSINSARLN